MFFDLFIYEDDENVDMERLVDKYSKNLMRLCYLYLKDYHLAEDAVQETFIKAYTKYSTFKRNSSEKTWITKVAINVCKNYMRKSSYKEVSSNESITLFYDSNKENETLYRDDEFIELLNAVYNLPEIYKQVILLYYYEGFTIAEISSILKQKEGTIAVRLKRGRDMLKDILKEEVL